MIYLLKAIHLARAKARTQTHDYLFTCFPGEVTLYNTMPKKAEEKEKEEDDDDLLSFLSSIRLYENLNHCISVEIILYS